MLLDRSIPWISLTVFLVAGCGTTHPRAADDLEACAERSRSVAVLPPRMDITWKYIGTDRWFSSPDLQAKCQSELGQALAARLTELGYSNRAVPRESAEPAVLGLEERVAEVSDQIIYQDPSYGEEVLTTYKVKGVADHAGIAQADADLVLVVWGEAKLETQKETTLRALKTTALGWMKDPSPTGLLSAASGAVFGSPEELWFRAALIDVRSGRIVYHNDYYRAHWTVFMSSVWETVAEALLEDLPDRS